MPRPLLLILASLPALAATPPVQTVSLPYNLPGEPPSSFWDIQNDGSINDGGNDLYDGGARLLLNNAAQYNSPNSQATLNATRTELVFPPMPYNGLLVSRRVAVLPHLNALRYVDLFENPTASAIRLQARLNFNMGGSVQAAIPLVDEKKNKQAVGYAFGDQRNAVAMIGAGRGARLLPRFNYRQHDDNIDFFYDLEIPARQTVAVAHLQMRRMTPDNASNAWKDIKDKQFLDGLPKEIRRKIVNFPGGDSYIGDLEILRGDTLDIVELRGGDTYRGTLQFTDFHLQTLYGPITLPANKVVCLINFGTYKPSQLLVTAEGEVFGGRLDIKTVPLRLSSGQITTIPLSQVTRLGYRRRLGEPEEWSFEGKPLAFTRSGERMRVALPTGDFNLATPSGPIRLSPALIASIIFQGEENNVPEVRLVDGSKISGLLGASSFNMTLVGLGAPQPASLPAAALTRFNFNPEQEPERLAPAFTLKNNDTLIGTLAGTLSLQTNFDTLHIEGNQVKRIVHTPNGNDHDIQLTLWDDSTVSGRLVESHIAAHLRCGLMLRLPIALVDHYLQPLPLPSLQIVKKVKEVAVLLDHDNWRMRDHAQNQIMSLGPSVMSVLKQIQPTAPAEASQRIQLMLDRLTEQLEGPATMQGPNPNHGTPLEFLGGINPPMILPQMQWDR